MVFGGHLEASPLDLVIVRATKRREVPDLELHSRSKAFIRDIVVKPLRRRYDVVGVYFGLILPVFTEGAICHIARR